MPFLKRIEAYGFKSFADPLKIEFDSNIVGIVGPNGSGKSNINDAIRWVLGEQSMKSLRGENAEDVIFNGAINKPPLNMAEVTLVFNNLNNIFNMEYQEIQITRRSYRNSSENEYYINSSRVRLKDVQELIMGTGLSKGSLSIISQGNVSQFADSKPEDRRGLFEEAAGVSKYKKRKEESLRKLTRTNENLTRVKDILSEIERKIEPLANQARKAKIYVEKHEILKKYEITIIVKDLKQAHEQISAITNKVDEGSGESKELAFKLSEAQTQLKNLKNRSYDLDKTINSLEMDLSNSNTLLSVLEQQKNLLKSKSETQTDDNKANALNNLKLQIQELSAIISQKRTAHQQELEKLETLKVKYEDLRQEHQDLIYSLNNLHQTIGKQKGNYQELLNFQHSQNRNSQGAQTVLKNRNSLFGIQGMISELIEVNPLYETAIVTILGNALQNIVTTTDRDATKAVNFLKANEAGIATFLPLNTIQVKLPFQDEKIIVNSQKGFLAFANDVVDPINGNKDYKRAIDFLLGRTIICDDIESARHISALIQAKYQCMTLDGQLIKAGGVIVGGYKRPGSQNLISVTRSLQETLDVISDLEHELLGLNTKVQETNSLSSQAQGEVVQSQVLINNLANQINEFTNRSQLLSTEYQSLGGKKDDISHDQLSDIYQQFEKTTHHKETLTSSLYLKRKEKNELLEKMQILENELFTWTSQQQSLSQSLNEERLTQIRLEGKVEQLLRRLVEDYRFTYEFALENYQQPLDNEEEARSLVSQLRGEIDDLGFVNLDAIEEYENESERYKRLKAKFDELSSAEKELLGAIDDMDKIMVEQFDQTIQAINGVISETFTRLFGGGSCSLRYTQPEDLLNTGIEVLANPPGKKISNLNLLSGGEKSLVALTVLFAILKVKPLPLTILDEVEAPLDPANVERFAKYIRDFSHQTQFIVVTHRPGTMENCDALYGTTMQNQGITKMVAIKLTDAKKLIKTVENPEIPQISLYNWQSLKSFIYKNDIFEIDSCYN